MYKQLQGLLIAIETKIPDERAVIGCKITKKKDYDFRGFPKSRITLKNTFFP